MRRPWSVTARSPETASTVARTLARRRSFDLDFASNVDAIFTVNPAIRPVRREVYCAGTPFVRPHVFAQLVIEPGTTRTLGTRPPGPLLVRALGRQRQVGVDAGARVQIAIGDDAAERGELSIVNRTTATATCEGSIVKTLGDGMMMCFVRPEQAVAASLRLAAPSQVVTSASLLEHERVHDVLARAQTTVQRLQSELEGFSVRYHVAAIDQPVDPAIDASSGQPISQPRA